jgi:8-oxo-dGTP diphosphatase
MTEKKEIGKVGVAAIRDGHLLVVRELGTSLFILPGGRPEPGEDDLTALNREIYEELGAGIVTNRLEFLGAFSDVAANDQDKIVTVRLYLGRLEEPIQALGEIEEIKWFDPVRDDYEILAPSIKNKILPFLKSTNLL